MGRFLIRRLLQAVPTLLAVSVVIFAIIHLAPGGPMAIYASSPNVDQAALDRIEERLGLNDPLPVQYAKWLSGMVTGDWGMSYKFGRDVKDVLGERLWASIQLVAASLIIALVFSIPFGIFSALNRNRGVQYLTNGLAMLGVSIPTFWLGMVVLLLLSVKTRIIPTGGMMTIGLDGFQPWDRLHHLLPPAAVLATLYIAGWSRYVRSSMLEVVSQDYIRTARAKGLKERVVTNRHALKNALLPLITLVGLQAGRLDRWRDDHRSGLCLAGHGTPAGRVAERPRLPGADGLLHADVDLGHRGQPRRRRRLWRCGSTHPVGVIQLVS